MPLDVTAEVRALLDNGGTAQTIGYLCVQHHRICAGCTSVCDQSVVLIYKKGTT